MNSNVLWITAALLPFVALLAVTEGTRSAVYGMEELELATRFSLKSVLLARLCLDVYKRQPCTPLPGTCVWT